MSERSPRLGDVIDDYCPRCRLLLNHDVAALLGQEIAKVTCRTCYNTHDYKRGQTPQKRKKKGDSRTLVEQVLAGMPPPPMPASPAPEAEPEPEAPAQPEQREKAAPVVHRRGNLWAELARIQKK